WREIYDAGGAEDITSVPFTLICAEGEDLPKKNPVLAECYENFQHTFDFFHNVFGRDSINNRGLPLVANIHFGNRYDNAYWHPTLRQMVFGDGGMYLNNFTSIDVIAHELTHGVTQFEANLEYYGQSGALNESLSDVFGSMVKQYKLGQTIDEADWLIGDRCLLPSESVSGLALRSMKDPGSAYDKLGFVKDPQPASMAKYVKTLEDNGGVHINSGIPNRAFYLAASRFGGHSWEQAGQIWYLTLTSGKLSSRCTFRQFADITCDIAGRNFGSGAKEIVSSAWKDVGV
ncbi:zincin, partial [Patellaria atrata CBS 101060]